MPLDFYAHAVVMGGNISASQVTLNCSHMSFDVKILLGFLTFRDPLKKQVNHIL
jgi:hypothetical protein